MKDKIRQQIADAIHELYPATNVDFAVDFAPDNIDADFSSNAPLVLAKKVGKRPMEIGYVIASVIAKQSKDEIAASSMSTRSPRNDRVSISVAAPGFINFKLDSKYWTSELEKIFKEQKKYGTSDIGRNKKINLEFVSANPTGPLTVGHGRGATIGSTLSRIMVSQGFTVVREYYFNDGGKQMQNLAESVRLRAKELSGEKVEFPENLYQGEYIKDIAAEYLKHNPLNLPAGQAGPPYLKGEGRGEGKILEFAVEKIFAGMKKTLEDLKVEFDEYFNELSLFDKTKKGNIWEVLAALRDKGVIVDKDGAVWLVHDNEEKVLVRSTGEPTYRLPDIAYHLHKLQLGYEKIINVLGADHIAQFPDVKFAVKTLGYDDSKIEVIINQFVALAGGPAGVAGASRKMSTRKATYVTLDELIAEVGADVTKFFMLMSGSTSHMTFDLNLARDTSDRNPVYKVQYAHARIERILEKAKLTSPNLAPSRGGEGEVATALGREGIKLIRELAKFPALLAEISKTYAVHQLPHYLLGLAEKFHGFYERVRVITDDEKETAARLALVKAAQMVLANGLRLMGIEPREKM